MATRFARIARLGGGRHVGGFIHPESVTGRVYDPSPYDHYRPTDDTTTPGVYRVVGLPGDDVTLLRVADESGRRVHTGRVERHPRTAFPASFERASNPDGRVRLGRVRRLAFLLVIGGATAQFTGWGGPAARWVTLAGAVLFLVTAVARRTGWA